MSSGNSSVFNARTPVLARTAARYSLPRITNRARPTLFVLDMASMSSV